MPSLNSLHSFLHEGNNLLFAAEGVVNVDYIISKLIISLIHQPEKDVQVMNAVKDERFILHELLFVLQECSGYIRVMKCRIEVMDGMVAIVPAILVVDIIDAVVNTAEMTLRVAFLDK